MYLFHPFLLNKWPHGNSIEQTQGKPQGARLSFTVITTTGLRGCFHSTDTPSTPAALSSCGRCNKSPQSGWLKTTQVFPHSFGARSLKSRCRQGRAPPEALGQFMFLAPPPSFQWLHHCSVTSVFSMASFASSLLSLVRTLRTGLRSS